MESLEEKQNISLLLDVYGGLLTDRQKDFIDLHYNEDLSFGEIASSADISRQAVHDAIQHGKKALEHFEEHLGLAKKQSQTNSTPTGSVDLTVLKQEITELLKMLNEDILYDTAPLKRKVQRLLHIVSK